MSKKWISAQGFETISGANRAGASHRQQYQGIRNMAERGGGGFTDSPTQVKSTICEHEHTAKTALAAMAAIKAEILAHVEEY